MICYNYFIVVDATGDTIFKILTTKIYTLLAPMLELEKLN